MITLFTSLKNSTISLYEDDDYLHDLNELFRWDDEDEEKSFNMMNEYNTRKDNHLEIFFFHGSSLVFPFHVNNITFASIIIWIRLINKSTKLSDDD